MKAQTVPAITPKTFKEIVTPWLTAIHKKDLLAVMSYPTSDRQRRLLNLLDQPKTLALLLPHASSYLFIQIDYRVDPVKTPEQLELFLLTRMHQQYALTWPASISNFTDIVRHIQKKTGKTIVVSAIGAEKLITDQHAELLIWSTTQQRIGVIRQILFFEANLFDADYVHFFGNVPAFQPRIATMTLYEKTDVLQFIRYKSQEWNFIISKSTEEAIYTHCGGILLLVKEALWFLRDHPNESMDRVWNHMEMQFNLASLWHGFGPLEQQTLSTIAHQLPITDFSLSQSLHYLLVTGIVKQTKNKFMITIPLLESYIHSTIPKMYNLSLINGSILLNNTPIDSNFSKNERQILVRLLQAKNVIVSRTTLADYLWPNNNGAYSDWALDSLISRIRKKLARLSVPPDIITVHKKQGVSLQK